MNYFTKLLNSLFHFIFNPSKRVNLLLFGGALMNLLYIATNAASAIIYHSIWSATLTVYHLTLIVIRVSLLFYGRVGGEGGTGRNICLRVGILLLFLDLIAAFIMLHSIQSDSFVSYSGLFLFGFLAFTVYSLVRSVAEIKRSRDSKNNLYFTAKNLSLTTALMSVFNLQYSLLSLLGADSVLTGRAILLCGCLVFSIILFLSLRLMRRGLSQ